MGFKPISGLHVFTAGAARTDVGKLAQLSHISQHEEKIRCALSTHDPLLPTFQPTDVIPSPFAYPVRTHSSMVLWPIAPRRRVASVSNEDACQKVVERVQALNALSGLNSVCTALERS